MQTSYSVDRAGTAEQEAEAAEEALLADAPEGSGRDMTAEELRTIMGPELVALVDPPKRVRRTREQIEQEKIEKAQARIEAIKVDQRNRRVKEARKLLYASYEAFEDADLSTDIGDAYRSLIKAIAKELGE